jgi:hypothetical protein
MPAIAMQQKRRTSKQLAIGVHDDHGWIVERCSAHVDKGKKNEETGLTTRENDGQLFNQ